MTFAPGEENVTAAILLTPDMISELEERFLLQLIERTSIGGALVEDLVVPPNVATVLIRDPGGELHRTFYSECFCLYLCEVIRASSIVVQLTCVRVCCVYDTTGIYVCTIIVHMTLCKDTYIHVWFSTAAQANSIHTHPLPLARCYLRQFLPSNLHCSRGYRNS